MNGLILQTGLWISLTFLSGVGDFFDKDSRSALLPVYKSAVNVSGDISFKSDAQTFADVIMSAEILQKAVRLDYRMVDRNADDTTKGSYYVIAASFELRSNAFDRVEQLQKKGYDNARVLPPSVNSRLYKVSYTRGLTEDKARKMLRNKFRPKNKDAWLYKYEGMPMH